MERKWINDLALGGFLLGALGLFAYMAIAVGGLKVGDAVLVKARFANAAGLVKQGAVMIAGVQVGSVDALSVDHDRAVVTLRLRTDASVRKDVKAAIRMKSLLGEKYVELLPQSTTAPMIRSGDLIQDTTVPVEVDEVMKQIGPVLKEVDPHEVAGIVHAVATVLTTRADALGHAIEAGDRAVTRVDRMLESQETNIGRSLKGLAGSSEHLPTLMARLDRMSAQLEPLTRSLETRGPSLVGRLDRLAAGTEPVVAALEKRGPGLITHLDSTLQALDPSLDRLPGTLDALDPSLRRLPGTLDSLDPTLKRLPATLSSLEKLVGRLEKTLDRVDPVLEQTRGREVFETDGSLKVKARLF
jgi:phospholipid/cholesterol/gamma-HCH transport system substrate-binding protein